MEDNRSCTYLRNHPSIKGLLFGWNVLSSLHLNHVTKDTCNFCHNVDHLFSLFFLLLNLFGMGRGSVCKFLFISCATYRKLETNEPSMY